MRLRDFLLFLVYLLDTRKGKRKAAPSNITNLRGTQIMSKTVKLVWVDPSSRVDGSPLPAGQIAKVVVSMSADAGANFVELGSVDAGVQTFSQADLPDGTYQFQVVVVDKQSPAKVSAPASVEVVVVTVLSEPSPVANLTASVL